MKSYNLVIPIHDHYCLVTVLWGAGPPLVNASLNAQMDETWSRKMKNSFVLWVSYVYYSH